MKTRNEPRKFNGSRIARERRTLRLSQEALADAVGLSRFQLIRIEQGRSGSIKTLNRVCSYLKIPIVEVFSEAA